MTRRSLRKPRRGACPPSWRAFRMMGGGEGQLRKGRVNAQNLGVVRNGFTRGWTIQRLDSVGATPNGCDQDGRARAPERARG